MADVLAARRKLILAKKEANAGTAESGIAAADAILVSEATLTPLTGGTVARDVIRSFFGNSDAYPINSHSQIEFTVELAGGNIATGQAITPPPWNKLLGACGFAETIGKIVQADAQNNKATYTPKTGSEDALTIQADWDKNRQQLVGCRGNVSLSLVHGQIPRLRFSFLGQYAAPAQRAQGDVASGSYGSWQAPRPGTKVDTPTFELMGVTDKLSLRSFELDMGVEVIYRSGMGAGAEECIIIASRAPSGTIVVDATSLSDFNPFTKAKAGDTGALKIVHGGADIGANQKQAKLIEINCPKVQLQEPSYGEDEGIIQWSIPFRPLPNGASGNDEVEIIVR